MDRVSQTNPAEAFKRRVVGEIAHRVLEAEELERVSERAYASEEVGPERGYWRFRRDQAANNSLLLWNLARALGQDVDRAVDTEVRANTRLRHKNH